MSVKKYKLKANTQELVLTSQDGETSIAIGVYAINGNIVTLQIDNEPEKKS